MKITGLRYEPAGFSAPPSITDVQRASGPQQDAVIASGRARSILQTGDRVWTAGLTWYLNRFVLLQVNAIRETVRGFPPPGQGGAWSHVLRLQLEL